MNIQLPTSNFLSRMCSRRTLLCSMALIFFTAAMCALPAPSFAAEAASEFDSANRLYEQGRFSEAAAAYEKLIQSGSVSPAIYFNLGNARFKNHEAGRALAAYHRAELLAPRDPDLRANLQFVQNQVPGPTLSPGRWQRALNHFTLNEWTTLASIALWVGLLTLVVIQLRPRLKPVLRGFILVSAVSAVVFCICLGAVWADSSGEKAVVTASDATVRNGPLDESPGVFTVHDGAELNVLDRKNDWLQVSAGDRRMGWLKREQIVLLPRG